MDDNNGNIERSLGESAQAKKKGSIMGWLKRRVGKTPSDSKITLSLSAAADHPSYGIGGIMVTGKTTTTYHATSVKKQQGPAT